MGDFYRCIDPILAEEGGAVNHSKDPGGETHFGISQRAYPHLNIETLTWADAVRLYQTDDWNPIKGDEFPAGLDLLLFDTAVNRGPATAIKLLQRALQIKEDGWVGNITLTTAQNAMPGILGDFCAERLHRYRGLRRSDIFGRGWYRRLFRI